MINVVFLLTLICLTVALIGSCAKKDDDTTSTTGVCSDCIALEATSTASGSITVGSETLSGTYATSCYTAAVSELVSSNSLPSDNLTAGTTYKTRVTTGVKDTAGNTLSSQYETSTGFTTDNGSSSSSSSASSVTAIDAGDDEVGFKECYCFFPFTHFILMFPFLSNNERYSGPHK